MEAPVTLRLDRETRRRIARIAARKRISKSEVIRQALASYAELQENSVRPYELVADLLGVVHGGDPLRSEHTGRKFTKLLKQRAAKGKRAHRREKRS